MAKDTQAIERKFRVGPHQVPSTRECRSMSGSRDRGLRDGTERTGSTREREEDRCGFVLGAARRDLLRLLMRRDDCRRIRLNRRALSFDDVLAERWKLFEGEQHQGRAARSSAASRLDAANASALSPHWNG